MKHRCGRNAANKGKHNCPNSKSVHESILENAFLEAYKLLAGSFDDVIDSVVGVIEDISTNNEDIGRLKKEQKALENLEQRRKKLTDLYLDEGISKEAYDEKYEDLSVKIQKSRKTLQFCRRMFRIRRMWVREWHLLKKHFPMAIFWRSLTEWYLKALWRRLLWERQTTMALWTRLS